MDNLPSQTPANLFPFLFGILLLQRRHRQKTSFQLFSFRLCFETYRIFVSQPGIKSASPALDGALNHWTTREGPAFSFSNSPFFFSLSLKWSNTVFFYLWEFRTFPDYYFFNSLINFWLCWVFLLCGFSLCAESGGYSSLPCAGFSLQRLLLLQSRLYGLQQLLWIGSAAPQRVGSSQTWDRGSVFCIGHFFFFYYWATREAPPDYFLKLVSVYFSGFRELTQFSPSTPDLFRPKAKFLSV